MINSCVDFTLCILSSFWPSRCSHINRKRLSCSRRDKSVVLYLFSSFHKFHQQTLTNTTIVLPTRLLFATLSPLAVTERTVFKSISRAHSSRLSHFLQSHTLWFNQGRRESGEYGISWKRCFRLFSCLSCDGKTITLMHVKKEAQVLYSPEMLFPCSDMYLYCVHSAATPNVWARPPSTDSCSLLQLCYLSK